MSYTQSQRPKSEKTWDLNSMYTKFTTALEASKVVDDLHKQIRTLNYNKDLRKLLKNCEHLVHVLGSAEVRARQLQKPYLANKAREDLAVAIDYLEKVIIVQKLSQ